MKWRTIKVSSIPKILAVANYSKQSLQFASWVRAHDEEEFITCYEEEDFILFMDADEKYTGAVLCYNNLEKIDSLKFDRKVVILLEENLDLQNWKKKEVASLHRVSNSSTNQLEVTPSHSSAEGWEHLLELYAPQDLYYNFIKTCQNSINFGSFFCDRNEKNEITEIIIWSLSNQNYYGHFWWSSKGHGESLRTLWQIHRQIESRGIINFYTYCRLDNLNSWGAHKLLGYQPLGKNFFTYELRL